MENKKLDIIDWLYKKRRYDFSEKNILDVFINELIYLYIQDQYNIFKNKLNLIKENDDNFKYLGKQFYKNIFNKKIDINKYILSEGISLNSFEKKKIFKNLNKRYLNKHVKSNLVKGSLDFQYLDWRNFILSTFNEELLVEFIKIFLLIKSNIRYSLNLIKYKFKNHYIKSDKDNSITLKTRSKYQLYIQKFNHKKYFLKNRKEIFITDIVYDPRIIYSNYFFVKSDYAILSYLGYKKQKFDPFYLSAIELIENPSIKFNESYLYKFYVKTELSKFGEIFNLKKSNNYYKLSLDNFFCPWAHENPIKYQLRGKNIDISIIKMNFQKIKNLISNIIEYGYVPTAQDIIEGYFLNNGREYRFIVISGCHRLAVIKALHTKNPLKFNYIPVKFSSSRSCTKIASKENIKNWPAVKNGTTKISDAREIIDSYF